MAQNVVPPVIPPAPPPPPAAQPAVAAVPVAPGILPLPARLDPNRNGNMLEAGYNAYSATQDTVHNFREALQLILAGNLDQAAVNRLEANLADAQRRLAQSEHLANIGRARAGGYEVIPIVTELPDFEGQIARGVALVDVIPHARDLPKQTLSGSEGRANDVKMVMSCRAFLDRIMHVSRQYQLSHAATRQLLYNMSSGEVQLIAGEMIREDRPLEDIVRKIEVTYGGLKSPEDARRGLEQIKRDHGEAIMEFGRRISQEARMATRMDPHRDSSYRALAVETILRKVPEIEPYIRKLDDDQVKGGKNRLTFDEVLLEATREEGRLRSHKKQMLKHNKHAVRQVYEEYDADTYYTATDDSEVSDDEVEQVRRVMDKFMDNRQNMRKRYPPKPGFMRKNNWEKGDKNEKAESKSKKPPPPPYPRRNPPREVRQVEEGREEPGSGDEGYLELSEDEAMDLAIEGINYIQGVYYVPNVGGEGAKPFVRITPQQLNIKDPKQCMKCGLMGHRAFGSQAGDCPLKGEPLMPNPCYKCHTGGHSSTKCPQGKKNPKN